MLMHLTITDAPSSHYIDTVLVVAGQCSVCWFSQLCPCVLASQRALPSAGEYLYINDIDNLPFWFFDYGVHGHA
jgi:hypothetical protein